MSDSNARIAVIYCRVSSKKQTKEHDGLGSQRTRCMEFARYKNYRVVETFEDDRSGSLIDRPGMKAMLTFLRENRAKAPVVVVDDISRLARGIDAHWQLRSAIGSMGGVLESPSIEFGEDADGIMRENLMATFAQHFRQKNAEQTVHRMRARVINGYWPFQCPVGYRHVKVKGQGNVLQPVDRVADIVREGLEGYASGRFDLQVEVKRFFERHADFPRPKNGRITNQKVTDILTQPVYAGLVHAPSWDVPLRRGNHQALISVETHHRILDRLNGKARAPVRKDISVEFPLRGSVVCGCCGTPLTSCWSTGRGGKKHPYYHCKKKGCDAYGKSIRRDVIQGEFEELLQGMRPADSLYRIACKMFRKLWDHRLQSETERKAALKHEITAIERKVDQLLDRIVETETPSVVQAFERRITEAEARKLELEDKLAQAGRPRQDFDTALRTALAFLGNPQKLWASGRIDYQKAVLKLCFAERLEYVRNEGFRTANLTLPFKALAGFCGPNGEMARPAGFEPATPSLEGSCSIQLS